MEGGRNCPLRGNMFKNAENSTQGPKPQSPLPVGQQC